MLGYKDPSFGCSGYSILHGPRTIREHFLFLRPSGPSLLQSYGNTEERMVLSYLYFSWDKRKQGGGQEGGVIKSLPYAGRITKDGHHVSRLKVRVSSIRIKCPVPGNPRWPECVHPSGGPLTMLVLQVTSRSSVINWGLSWARVGSVQGSGGVFVPVVGMVGFPIRGPFHHGTGGGGGTEAAHHPGHVSFPSICSPCTGI